MKLWLTLVILCVWVNLTKKNRLILLNISNAVGEDFSYHQQAIEILPNSCVSEQILNVSTDVQIKKFSDRPPVFVKIQFKQTFSRQRQLTFAKGLEFSSLCLKRSNWNKENKFNDANAFNLYCFRNFGFLLSLIPENFKGSFA